jgi:hypothetical protein
MTTPQQFEPKKPNWDFWISSVIILAMAWFAYKIIQTLMHGGDP